MGTQDSSDEEYHIVIKYAIVYNNNIMQNRRKFLLIFLSILVVALALIALYFYQKNKNIPESIPPTITQESITKELKEFKIDPQKIKDPKIVEQELKSFKPNEATKLSDEEILDSLNDPNIVPLPKSNP